MKKSFLSFIIIDFERSFRYRFSSLAADFCTSGESVMKVRWTRLSLVILLAPCVMFAACSSTSGSSSTTSGSPSVTAPLAISPGAAASVPNLSQPVTLIVRNAVATGTGNVYTFEVSTDAAFGSKIYTKSGVAEDPGGQTGIVIDKLPAGADYFWRARADSGGTTGPYNANRQ